MTDHSQSVRTKLKHVVDKIKDKLETQITDEDSDKIASELSTEEDDDQESTLLSSPGSLISNVEMINEGKTARKLLKQVASLKLQVQEKKIECDLIRREFQSKIVQLEEEHAKESHQMEMDLLKIQTQSTRKEKDLTTLQSKMEKQVEELKEKIEKMEKDKPIIEEQIRQIKSQFINNQDDVSGEGLVISDSRYSEIKRLDYNQQTLKQYIQCQVYELLHRYREIADTTQRQNDILTENLRQTVSQLDKLNREQEHVNLVKSEEERDYKTQISFLEMKVNKLSKELQDKIVEAQENSTKAQMFDSIKSRANELEDQNSHYQKKLEFLEATLLSTQHERENLSQKLNTTAQQLEILKNDKMYLLKEVETLSSRINRAEEQIDQQQSKIKAIRAEKRNLFDKFVCHKDNSRTDHERMLQEEVSKIKEQTRLDLGRIKSEAKETFERENRMLREAKEHSESQLERNRQQLQELREAHDILSMDYRSLSSNMEKQLNELRSQLKLKVFENERMNVTLIETTNNLKTVKSECEVMRQKTEVLKTGYYNLQTETGKRIAELETSLQACKNELNGYKDLERELDRAVEMYTPNIESESEFRMFDKMTSMIPTNTTRCLKYSLYLTRRISELEKCVQQSRKEIEDRDAKISVLTERLQKTQQNLEHTSQPYNFLVATIENKDKEIERYNTYITELEKQLSEQKKEVIRISNRNKQLEEDIEKLIVQQDVINKLKNTLIQLRDENMNPSLVKNLINKLNK